MELCVVSCGKKKIWDVNSNAPRRVPAKYAYVGTLTRLAIKYAEKFYPNDWVIISAKYGLMHPDEEIENYDIQLLEISNTYIELLKKQIREKGLDKYSKIIVIGSKRYVEACILAFNDKIVIDPLSGLGLYERIRILSQALKNNTRIEVLRSSK